VRTSALKGEGSVSLREGRSGGWFFRGEEIGWRGEGKERGTYPLDPATPCIGPS
jgi:hypothetical protein